MHTHWNTFCKITRPAQILLCDLNAIVLRAIPFFIIVKMLSFNNCRSNEASLMRLRSYPETSYGTPKLTETASARIPSGLKPISVCTVGYQKPIQRFCVLQTCSRNIWLYGLVFSLNTPIQIEQTNYVSFDHCWFASVYYVLTSNIIQHWQQQWGCAWCLLVSALTIVRCALRLQILRSSVDSSVRIPFAAALAHAWLQLNLSRSSFSAACCRLLQEAFSFSI